MKKVFIVLLLTTVCLSGVFAFNLGDFPKGTWTDTKWNADWEFGIDTIQLKDSTTGKLIFAFTDDKISNFKISPSTDGLTISFSCTATNRSYTFTKPMTLDTSIVMEIDPTWTNQNYKVTMPFKK